jgi:prepilin-type N-terminal cleavage/methylation domain-containing protein
MSLSPGAFRFYLGIAKISIPPPPEDSMGSKRALSPPEALIAPAQAGFSLLELVVAMAIMGIVAMSVLQMTAHSTRSARAYAQQGEREDLRRFIRFRLDCATSKIINAGAGAGSGSRSNYASVGNGHHKGTTATPRWILADRNNDPIAPLDKDGLHNLAGYKFRAVRQPNGDLTVEVAGQGEAGFKNLFAGGAPLTCP